MFATHAERVHTGPALPRIAWRWAPDSTIIRRTWTPFGSSKLLSDRLSDPRNGLCLLNCEAVAVTP